MTTVDTGLKTVMDFNLAFIVPDAFNEANDPSDGASKGLFNIYVSLANDFLYEDTENILIFLDNHDLSRFARKDDSGLDKYRQGVAFILTTRGIPQIYYGTELLFTGTKNEGDGIIRKDMPGGRTGDGPLLRCHPRLCGGHRRGHRTDLLPDGEASRACERGVYPGTA